MPCNEETMNALRPLMQRRDQLQKEIKARWQWLLKNTKHPAFCDRARGLNNMQQSLRTTLLRITNIKAGLPQLGNELPTIQTNNNDHPKSSHH